MISHDQTLITQLTFFFLRQMYITFSIYYHVYLFHLVPVNIFMSSKCLLSTSPPFSASSSQHVFSGLHREHFPESALTLLCSNVITHVRYQMTQNGMKQHSLWLSRWLYFHASWIYHISFGTVCHFFLKAIPVFS